MEMCVRYERRERREIAFSVPELFLLCEERVAISLCESENEESLDGLNEWTSNIGYGPDEMVVESGCGSE